MTTDHQMATMYAAQHEVIAALYGIGEFGLVGRLEHCMQAWRDRYGGMVSLSPCRSPTCAWRRQPLIRGWWLACADGRQNQRLSLAIMHSISSAGLCDGVRMRPTTFVTPVRSPAAITGACGTKTPIKEVIPSRMTSVRHCGPPRTSRTTRCCTPPCRARTGSSG